MENVEEFRLGRRGRRHRGYFKHPYRYGGLFPYHYYSYYPARLYDPVYVVDSVPKVEKQPKAAEPQPEKRVFLYVSIGLGFLLLLVILFLIFGKKY